jgi:predicted DNA-binding transcriptional regulator AlpA
MTKGTRKPPAVPAGALFASAPQVCKIRYGGRSTMWLNRILKSDPEFPRPVYFGRLRFFKISELEEYERSRVRGRVAP